MVSFGPFLTRCPGESPAPDKIEHTGFALEYSSAHQGVSIPLYLRKDRAETEFNDYVFRVQDAPVRLKGRPFDSVQTQVGLFVRLEMLLVALYAESQVARPVHDFLSEFRASLPLNKSSLFPSHRPRIAFKPEATQLGFYLNDLFSYGRTISVSVAWYCPQDRKNVEEAPYWSAGVLDFRPRPDGTLNPGKWIEPVPGHLIWLHNRILRKSFPGTPLDLLSDEGEEIVLGGFKWSPLARMTGPEAKKARLEFARTHPQLHDDPRALAQAMRKAQLYSEGTSLTNILKHLGPIITAAKIR